MKPIIIIPARGGSKGVPRKNVHPICGRPLIAWNLLAACEACGPENVYVTTDDLEISNITTSYGAKAIRRPSDLAGDKASSESALIHALEHIKQERGGLPAQFIFLQCTSPLTTAEDIVAAAKLIASDTVDCVLSATRSHRFLWRNGPADSAEGINHNSKVRQRRQDLNAEYAENGAIYAMQTAGFLEHRHRFFGRITIYEMPENRSWDIDSESDLQVAEILLRQQLHENRAALLPAQPSAVVFDFDGVMTDNTVLTDQDGHESVRCNRSDGLGIADLKKLNIPMVVISTEVNPVVAARCNKLQIICIQGQTDKAQALQNWARKNRADLAQTIYLGNDRNDAECMELAGCPVAVDDAYPEALQRALIVLNNKGGQGAVRELCDLILSNKS